MGNRKYLWNVQEIYRLEIKELRLSNIIIPSNIIMAPLPDIHVTPSEFMQCAWSMTLFYSYEYNLLYQKTCIILHEEAKEPNSINKISIRVLNND